MAIQVIERNDPFGRIGKSFGEGLSEQLPRELERKRLSQGLQSFEKDSANLTPMQQASRLFAIPGITPQMIQTFGELAKEQNRASAYGNRAREGEIQSGQISPNIKDVKFANLPVKNGKIQNQDISNIQRTPNIGINEFGQPQIVNENPLDEKALPRAPWSPSKRDQTIDNYIKQGFRVDQAKELAADDEARYLAEPSAYQSKLDALTKKQTEARSALTRHLETKLQKKGEDLFKDVSGSMMINLERGMERDLRLNPEATLEDVANDWSNRALELAKTKTQFDQFAATTGLESLFKGEQTIKKLKEYSDSFKRAGNSEEYYNLLISSMGLSPQAAASISYPINKGIREYLPHYKKSSIHNIQKREANARNAAIAIEKHLSSDDSLLSAAKALRDVDPFFDQETFFDQLSEDKDNLRLNERQRRELQEGVSNILPTWSDVLVLPINRRY